MLVVRTSGCCGLPRQSPSKPFGVPLALNVSEVIYRLFVLSSRQRPSGPLKNRPLLLKSAHYRHRVHRSTSFRGHSVSAESGPQAETSHLHYCAGDPESKLPTREELERTAYERASHHARRVEGKLSSLHVLHVEAQNFRMNALYKVDPKKRVLVEKPSLR